MRVGQGYDVHRLTEGRKLILGGVEVPFDKGLLGHSDADALLGAAALGDIGQHFPDTDPAYEGISSIELLRRVGALLEEKGYVVENIDATIIAQKPKMAPYIFTERNGIHIIDLQKSVGKVDEAYRAVFEIASQGGTILFVGTKKQAQDAVKAEAERCGMYYVNERWLGGMLTNFKTIRSRIERLKAIETMSEDGTFDVLPKKEVIALKKEWEKLEKNLGGIKAMTRIPDAIFVVDPKKERICVQEAHTLGITLIGIGDTNCDPEELDYIIPGNDDAIRAVKLIVAKMADAVIEANQGEEAVTAEMAEAAEQNAEPSDIEEVAAADVQ